ncbi:hypothetical protein QJQ45_020897 [Haematococcus lacustris]|nr:hypothetical protein QJQ45_020897 [Haematococcus lacustris]
MTDVCYSSRDARRSCNSGTWNEIRPSEENDMEEDMAEVSIKRHRRDKQLVVFFGAASIGTRGGWGADAVLRACRKVVCRPRGTDQRRGRVVLVDEHRTTRVSSAMNGQQPCERQLNKRRATRPAGWKPPAGQVEPRLLRPAWSQQRDQPVRGMMWCPVVAPRKPPQAPRSSQEASQPAASEPGPSSPLPAKRSKRIKAEQPAEPTQPTKGKGKAQSKAAKAKPAPQPGRWLDRDCNAALNMQRIGESKWRPLELCWWPDQGALPAKGKEYPGLGYKRLRDKQPKAQQQPAAAQQTTRGAKGSVENPATTGAHPPPHLVCPRIVSVPACPRIVSPHCVPACQNVDCAWPQVMKVPEGAVLRGCKKTKRKLKAHFQLRAGVHSQLRVIASLYVLRIFLTCLVGYSTPGFRSAPTPPAVQPPRALDAAPLPPLPLRVPAQPASMAMDWDPEPDPDALVFCEYFANSNLLTPYNQLQRWLGRPKQNLHYSIKPAFDDPSNQELLAKLKQLGSVNLTGDHNTISHHSMQLASSELQAATLDKGHVADLIEEAAKQRRLLALKETDSLRDTMPLPYHMRHAVHVCRVGVHFIKVDSRVLHGVCQQLGLTRETRDVFTAEPARSAHWNRWFRTGRLANQGVEFERTVETDGVSAVSAASGVWAPATGQLMADQLHRWKLTKGQVRHGSGLNNARRDTERWLAPIKPHLQHLAAASSAGTSLVANLKHITVTLATWDAVWEVYLDPKWAQQRLRLYGAQDWTLEQFFKKMRMEEDMAEVSTESHGHAKQLVVFFGAASIGTRGGWGADAVLRACCKVVCRPRGTDQRRGRVVLVDEHRTTRVSSAMNGQQPCERQLNKRRATRPAGWKPPAGQVEPRLLRPAWSQQRDQPVRGMMWCPVVAPRKPPQAPRSSQEASQPAASEPGPIIPLPAKRSKLTKAEQAARPTKAQGKAAKAKPAPQPGRWLDRDCNAAMNMQRIGESRWRPLELCWWPEQGKLPAKGKEYHGLGYKRLRDKPPKAQQQQQQPAEAQQGVDQTRSLVIAASAGGPPDSSSSSGGGDQADALEKLLRSKVFSSGMVVREFNSLVDEMMLLTRMSTKFPDFDLAGKRMYVDKMTEAHERYKIFYNRLLLSDDPAAKEYLRTTDANMSSGGEPSQVTFRDTSSTSSGTSGSSSSTSSSCSTSSSSGSSSCNSKMHSSNSSNYKRDSISLRRMVEGMASSLEMYKQWVMREEAAVAAGPAAHQQYLQSFRTQWQQSSLGAMDFDFLVKNISPDVMMKAQKDPQTKLMDAVLMCGGAVLASHHGGRPEPFHGHHGQVDGPPHARTSHGRTGPLGFAYANEEAGLSWAAIVGWLLHQACRTVLRRLGRRKQARSRLPGLVVLVDEHRTSQNRKTRGVTSEPGLSAPLPAKHSKRTKAEQVAEPTQLTKAQAKARPRLLQLGLPDKGRKYPGLGYKRL